MEKTRSVVLLVASRGTRREDGGGQRPFYTEEGAVTPYDGAMRECECVCTSTHLIRYASIGKRHMCRLEYSSPFSRDR